MELTEINKHLNEIKYIIGHYGESKKNPAENKIEQHLSVSEMNQNVLNKTPKYFGVMSGKDANLLDKDLLSKDLLSNDLLSNDLLSDNLLGVNEK